MAATPRAIWKPRPPVDDGIMYVTDGWGSVYAIDVRSGRKGEIKWKFDPGVDRGC